MELSYQCQVLTPNSKDNTRREAIVVIFTNDLYLPAILVLGYTLNKYNATNGRDMIALIPRGAIYDPRHIAMLKVIGWSPIYAGRLSYPGKVLPQLVDGLMKLYAWNMTQYDIIVTIDADAIVVGSIEEPFQQMRTNHSIQMMAVDDAGIPLSYRKGQRHYFNSGVLFFRPNRRHFNKLVDLSSDASYYKLDFPQQNLLNKYFRNQWVELPSKFNMLSHLNGRHNLWANETEDLRIIHFAGTQKPWECLYKLKGAQVNTDIIWRRSFADLVAENRWHEDDFLPPLASTALQRKLRCHTLMNIDWKMRRHHKFAKISRTTRIPRIITTQRTTTTRANFPVVRKRNNQIIGQQFEHD